MTDVALLLVYMGAFGLMYMLAAFILFIITFAYYKKSKGKLSFWQFAKRWKA